MPTLVHKSAAVRVASKNWSLPEKLWEAEIPWLFIAYADTPLSALSTAVQRYVEQKL